MNEVDFDLSRVARQPQKGEKENTFGGRLHAGSLPL